MCRTSAIICATRSGSRYGSRSRICHASSASSRRRRAASWGGIRGPVHQLGRVDDKVVQLQWRPPPPGVVCRPYQRRGGPEVVMGGARGEMDRLQRVVAPGHGIHRAGLVVDDQLVTVGGLGSGSLTTALVPTCGSDSKSNSPPMRRNKFCVRNKPSPMPCPGSLVVKNGSPARARISGGMPLPRSSTPRLI